MKVNPKAVRSDGCTVDIRGSCFSPETLKKLFAGGKVDALQQVEQHLQVQSIKYFNSKQVNNEKVGA
jgi:hypothetical protein